MKGWHGTILSPARGRLVVALFFFRRDGAFFEGLGNLFSLDQCNLCDIGLVTAWLPLCT